MQTFSLRGTLNTAGNEDWMTSLPRFAISSGDSKRIVLPLPGQQPPINLRQPVWTPFHQVHSPLTVIAERLTPPAEPERRVASTNTILLTPFSGTSNQEESNDTPLMGESDSEIDRKYNKTNKMYEERWEEMFEQLKEFKAHHGHCNVRQRYKNSQLGHWVNSMRGRKKSGELSEERIRKLTELGFVWQYRKKAWQTNYEELIKFKETFGHCNVPTSWEQNPKLGRWVQYMRKKKLSGKLSAEQIQKLEDLGIEWRPSSSGTNTKADLASDMDSNNSPVSSDVEETTPSRSDDNTHTLRHVDSSSPLQEGDDGSHTDLPRVVSATTAAPLRHHSRKSEESLPSEDAMEDDDDSEDSDAMDCLTAAAANASVAPSADVDAAQVDRKTRKRKLPSPSCAPSSPAKTNSPTSWPRPTWYQRYEQLKIFKARFGHCKVPYRWAENPGLGRWVSLMRKKRKEGKLEEHKEKLLNELSFAWSLVGYRTRLDKRAREDEVVEDKVVAALPSQAPEGQRRGWKFVDEGTNTPSVELELSMPPKKRRRMLDASDSNSGNSSPRSTSSAQGSFDSSDSEQSVMEQDEDTTENMDCADGFSLILQAAKLLSPADGDGDGEGVRKM